MAAKKLPGEDTGPRARGRRRRSSPLTVPDSAPHLRPEALLFGGTDLSSGLFAVTTFSAPAPQMSHFGSSGKGYFDQRCAGLTPAAAARLRDSRLGGSSARAPFPRAADARPGRRERPKPVLLPAPLDVSLLKHRSVAGGSSI